MKNILFLVPDSTGIRNYLYSDILSHLKNKATIYVWSPLPEKVFEDVGKLHNIHLLYQQFPFPKEPFASRWYRESATFARLHWNAQIVKNETILTNWNYKIKGGVLKKMFHKSYMLVGLMIKNNYDSILNFEEKARVSWPETLIKDYEEKLLDAGIEKIFITHQRVAKLMPLCLAAQYLGIEVITVIYSWDNLPKARLNVLADKYLVWSDYMKDEMATYYPEIPQQKMIVTGTPQFEFYNKREFIVERETFAKQYQLDPNKKWLLYSGGDTYTSPFDQEYLADVCKALKEHPEYQIVFRRSPADFSDRFNKVLSSHLGQLISIDPIWEKGEQWSSNIPKAEDQKMLINLAYHCFAAVNVGSTIAHDFANFDRPSIYINYEPSGANKWSIKVINSFQHFRSMPSSNAVIWINSPMQWKDVINNAIEHPNKYAIDRIRWLEIINKDKPLKPSEAIANILIS